MKGKRGWRENEGNMGYSRFCTNGGKGTERCSELVLLEGEGGGISKGEPFLRYAKRTRDDLVGKRIRWDDFRGTGKGSLEGKKRNKQDERK